MIIPFEIWLFPWPRIASVILLHGHLYIKAIVKTLFETVNFLQLTLRVVKLLNRWQHERIKRKKPMIGKWLCKEEKRHEDFHYCISDAWKDVLLLTCLRIWVVWGSGVGSCWAVWQLTAMLKVALNSLYSYTVRRVGTGVGASGFGEGCCY